jgi:anti-sigma factor RsiW
VSAAIPGDLTCKELVEVVTDYLEDQLTVAERTRFELHLCTCTGCRAYLSQMRAVVRAAGRLAERDIPVHAKLELLQAFRAWKQQ